MEHQYKKQGTGQAAYIVVESNAKIAVVDFQIAQRAANLLFDIIFDENCMEMKNNCGPRSATELSI